MIKLLIGGSPCTHWSIAQTKNRETEANGIGWELFRNYLIAKEKFKPDFFLYENNKSAAKPIKDQIEKELGVDIMYINSALLSAQNRQRFYAFNWKVDQPKDRGILLSDVLENNSLSMFGKQKSYAILSTYGKASMPHALLKREREMVAEPVRIGALPKPNGELSTSQAMRIYDIYGKSVTLSSNAGGLGGKTGLLEKKTGKKIYRVENGEITIKSVKYPIALPDGEYIIRKLTPIECERLQTLPDNYTSAVSTTQRYRGLGNGWTAEVIIHILNGALKDVPKDEEIVCLSMYDGIGTGRYCLDKMGFKNVRYYAYEIDKFAMKVANSNFQDIIQCGDAFDVRRDDWRLIYG